MISCRDQISSEKSMPLPMPLPSNSAKSPFISLGWRLLKSTTGKTKLKTKDKTKDAVELVFKGLLIFTLTCIGAMALICFIFEIENRLPASSPTLHHDIRSSPNIPAQSEQQLIQVIDK